MTRRLLIAVAALGLVGLFAVLRELYRPYQGYSGSRRVVVEPGTRALAVAELLVANGVLPHRLPFLFRYWLSRPFQSLKAGEYLFDRPLRPVDVYRRLVRGDIFLHPVVIPEGSDRFDMARIFRERLGLDPEEFLRLTERTAAIRDLDPGAPSLEGYLFPDTYRFPRGVNSATVVATMLARFRQVLDAEFSQDLRQSPGNLHDVITLASLVEKETPASAERPVIAGVFTKRLELGRPLQCDPTVVYAVRLSHRLIGRSIGPINHTDLDFDSPYNTYRHVGLPPGPIASPGEASIRAALKPASGDLLYFVSNNQGGHVFARTLAEHQRNVARYRRRVAAVPRVVPNRSRPPSQTASLKHRGKAGAVTSSRKGAEKTEQETTDPR